MNLPGLVGRAFRFVWQDGELPGKRWLSQVSRWIAGIESQDQSVVIAYHDNGINIQVNDALYKPAVFALITSRDGVDPTLFHGDVYGYGINNLASEEDVTIKLAMPPPTTPIPDMSLEWWVMVRPSFDDTYDYDGYFHGVANKAQIAALSNQTWTSPTIAGATVKLLSFDENEVKLDYDTTGTNYISLATTYISSATGVLGFDVSTAAAVSPAAQVASNILKISNGSSVRLDATAYGAGGNIFKVLTTDTGGYADVLEFDTSTSADITAGLQVTTDGYLQARVQEPVLALTTDSPVKLQVVESGNYSSWASGLQFDLSTEVDLAPESQITTGGYLQTRCKKIKLVLTTDSPAKLQLAASSNYGSWVNGPTVGECT